MRGEDVALDVGELLLGDLAELEAHLRLESCFAQRRDRPAPRLQPPAMTLSSTNRRPPIEQGVEDEHALQ